MRLSTYGIAFIGIMLAVAGCEQLPNPPLIFGQTHTVGITVSGSTTDQGAEITVGYKDRNFAIVPATVQQPNGASTQILGTASNGFQDALSVLGQFSVKVEATNPKVGLGKFFATGIAAQKLADGFAAELGLVQPPAGGTQPPAQ